MQETSSKIIPDNKRIGIELENVSFSYGDTKIFESLSFSVPEDEIWAVVARSGAGKTTLLHLISGLFIPKYGIITVNGRKPGPGSIRGVVFQDESLLGWLNIEENVLFHSASHEDIVNRDLARKMLDAVGLADRYTEYPHEFSAGMRKRAEFARALLADDEYILADEPFGTVDALTRRELWRLWLNLRQDEPRTGVLCTHDPEEAIRLCDEVVTFSLQQPTTLSHNIHVPESVKNLDAYSENSDLRDLKQMVIESL